MKVGKTIRMSGQPLTAMNEIGNGEKDRLYEKDPFQQEVITARRKVKFEVYGEEMIEKEVKYSGNSGRVYLPPEWVGKHIKVIRTD